MTPEPFTIPDTLSEQTLAAVLRHMLPGQSWKQVGRLIESRRITINDGLCIDAARRVRTGDRIGCLTKAVPPVRAHSADSLVIRHVDEHIVILEKPSGVSTVRHPAEREWSEHRRELDPTLEDLTQWALARQLKTTMSRLPRLRTVQRLDKDTSGLVVFARSVSAERILGQQFHDHIVTRRYLAVVPGVLLSQRIESTFVRDRGDGRRGSTPATGTGKKAITHIEVAERLPGYTLLKCRLETGRTHQIRIHLSELGHPVCGDRVYQRMVNNELVPDRSGAPRLALHAAELGFQHPQTTELVQWTMPLPRDLARFLEDLRT